MAGIRFQKIVSIKPAVDYVFNAIEQKLKSSKKVLWLVPGGSAMEIAVKAADLLQNSPNRHLLTISLTDERYGPPGHEDSNWQQLISSGFKLEVAHLAPVLDKSSFDETAEKYSKLLRNCLGEADYSIALGGMGTDGHIFGIKPRSPAIESGADVIAYISDDYYRLTPTGKLIERLDEIVIYATGSEKHHQLDDLDKELPARDQPAQLLKKVPKVIIFNDYKDSN